MRARFTSEEGERLVIRAKEFLKGLTRTDGFVAMFGNICCSSCAMAALDERGEREGKRKVAWFHRQDVDSAVHPHRGEKPVLFLGYGWRNEENENWLEDAARVGRELADLARRAGFQVEWSGKAQERIVLRLA